MTKSTYDVIILGGGNAGMGVTVPTREAGKSVAMIEERDLGGTCPNRGCTPKKVLVAAAHTLHEIDHAAAHKIAVGSHSFDWAGLIDRTSKMIAGIPGALKTAMEKRGVDVIRDAGVFAGPNSVRVGERLLEAEYIVIATGSKPRPLSFSGSRAMITSDEVLNGRDLPSDVVFVGGGVIALEFSHVYARAGSSVTILEAMPQILPNMDTEAVEQVRAMSEALGITFRTNAAVRRIEQSGSQLRVIYEHDGLEKTVVADRVVNGAGRVANIDTLDLDKGGISHQSGRVEVDAFLQSVSNPAVYVCGDAVSTSPQLSPVATYEGQMVGRNIVEGAQFAPDYSTIPSCVYTVPALASVGLTEHQAKARNIDCRVHVSDMSGWLSTKTYAETTAWSKILIDSATDQIVGAHLAGHAGEELIHLFAFAMKHGITAQQIKDTIYGFPTFSSDIKNML